MQQSEKDMDMLKYLNCWYAIDKQHVGMNKPYCHHRKSFSVHSGDNDSANDSEIMSWDVNNLKEYLQSHSEFYVSTINSKPQLQFIALDCTEWTLERISKNLIYLGHSVVS